MARRAAERLEPYLGKRWSKATFSAAERSAFPETRAREFSADRILAFACALGFSVSWFLLPPELEGELPNVSCGGPALITPRDLVDAAVTRGPETEEGWRLRSLTRRLPLTALDGRIQEAGLARVAALASTTAGITSAKAHADDLRRVANALERAENAAQELFAAAYENEQRKENDSA